MGQAQTEGAASPYGDMRREPQLRTPMIPSEFLRTGITRKRYFLTGALLFAVKTNLDKFLAMVLFGKPWESYLKALQHYYFLGDTFSSYRLLSGNYEDAAFHLTLLSVSLPFMLAGLTLTWKRLHCLNLHPWTLVLFFVPYLQILFFILLSILPPDTVGPAEVQHGDWLSRYLPRNRFGAALTAMVLTAAVGLGLAFFSVNIMNTYGGFLFVGLPFVLGMLSSLLYKPSHEPSLKEVMGVAMLSLGLVALLLLALALEGILCLLMAAPIAAALAALGVLLGEALKRAQNGRGAVAGALMLLLPGLMGMESLAKPEPTLYELRSSVQVLAPPETVWRQVITFSDLPEPTEAIFRIGIAYPTHATIEGKGAGSIRKCHFSTGTFVEPIVVWDEPRQLAFDVLAQPAPMKEWSFYQDVHAPHLSGFLVSKHGRFLLTDEKNGTTLLEGTTWYQHHMWPEAYWKLWADYVIHKIHMRVLNHIKSESEAGAGGFQTGS
jgi:hypothetical protein